MSSDALPFLKGRKIAAVIIQKRKPSGEMQSIDEGETSPIVQAAEDLLSAIEMKDPQAVADALESAFAVCDSMPHEEEE